MLQTRVRCKAWQGRVLGSGAGGGRVAKSRVAVVFLPNGRQGSCWLGRVGVVGRTLARIGTCWVWLLESGGSGAGRGRVVNRRGVPRCQSVGGLGMRRWGFAG